MSHELRLILNELVSWATFLRDRIAHTFNGSLDLSSKEWIRMLAVVGAYLLIRPLFIWYGEYLQKKNLAKVANVKTEHYAEKAREGQVNSLRGAPTESKVGELESTGNDDAAATTGLEDEGKKIKKRQKKVTRFVMTEEERQRKEVEEDALDEDVSDFMVNPAISLISGDVLS